MIGAVSVVLGLEPLSWIRVGPVAVAVAVTGWAIGRIGTGVALALTVRVILWVS